MLKILVRFNVDKSTSFYADTQYLVLTDAWSDKTQGIKTRYSSPNDFTSKMGAELTNNLANLRGFILNAMTEDAKHDMGNIRKLENGSILEKYGNCMPKSHEQKVNKFIKEIARQAGITDPVEIAYIENGEKNAKRSRSAIL